jgi:glycosyltransferase involved in cell wall biosynthesis
MDVESRQPERCLVIMPGYQEERRIAETVAGALKHCDRVLVVDDGSADNTAKEARRAGAEVIVHETNKGKGIALNTGFQYAEQHGFDVVITMDADGQHDPGDIPAFLEEHRGSNASVVVGNRMSHPDTMPLVRRLTNRTMSWLLSRKIGQCVPDTQCGYRLYRRDVLPHARCESARFAAESEVLLNLAARGATIRSVPIAVIYRDEKSKINPVKDTFRFFAMLRKYSNRGVKP